MIVEVLTLMLLENAPDVLTVPEVARLLRVNRNTAYDLVRKGALYGARIGHVLRVPRSEVERFLSRDGGREEGIPERFTVRRR